MFDNLRTRLFASYIVVVLVTVTLAGAAFYFLVDGYRDSLSTATLRQVAVPVSFQLSQLRRPAEVRPFVAYLRDQTSSAGVGAVIVDGDGLVVADANPELPRLLGERFDLPPIAGLPRQIDQLYRGEHRTADDRTLEFLVIPFGPPAPGDTATSEPRALVLFLPRESAGELVRSELAPRLLLAGAAGLVVALIIGAVLVRWLYQPLGRLRKAASDVAAGNLSTKVAESGPRETRELAADFNRMTEEVSAGRGALHDFLIDTSHELRTPLTSVRGFSQAMIDGTIDDDEGRHRAAEIIQRETDRLLRLVNELSHLARLESGGVALQRSTMDVGPVISEAAEAFGPLAEAASVALRVDVDEGLPQASIDRDRIEQVLANLVDNALRHTPPGGEVRISARRDGSTIEAGVSDTGTGIPASELPHVFDRFYRGTRGSSGLGLTISREIARAHGGEIRVESVEGEGTRFTFTLPIAVNTDGRAG